MNLVSTLLPGVRDLRAGSCWGHPAARRLDRDRANLSAADKATGLYRALLDLNDVISFGATAVIALVASILGGVLSTFTTMVVNRFLRSAWPQTLDSRLYESAAAWRPQRGLGSRSRNDCRLG